MNTEPHIVIIFHYPLASAYSAFQCVILLSGLLHTSVYLGSALFFIVF